MIYLFESKIASIILSIIWGLGLASLFKKVCHDRNCIVYRAPDPVLFVDQTYKYDNSCYKFDTELSRCRGNIVDT